MRRLLAPISAVTAAAALALLPDTSPVTAPASIAARASMTAPTPGPPPTENWLSESAERDKKQHRKAWFKAMHAAPPGVDWRALERENGHAQIDKRNAMALGVRPPLDAFGGAWVERGSENQAGRMRVARYSPDGTLLYAGSDLGGVWRGSPDGEDWTPIGDNLYGGTHWLAVSPGDHSASNADNIVLTATDGGDLHYTQDDGTTWLEPTGLPGNPRAVRRLLQLSDGSYTVFMVYTNDQRLNFLLRSTDGGRSFEVVLELGSYEGDVWTPRDGDTTLYAIAGDDAVMSSEDLGDTWETAGAFPDFVSSGQAELTGSEAGAPRLWAVLDYAELYRSDDAGGSWDYLGRVSDYWGVINASIIDPDRFAWGGVEITWTRDGGERFDSYNYWGDYYDRPEDRLHADLWSMDTVPDGAGGETWFINTDGGLFRSSDSLATVENLSLSGLRVSQYYGTLTSAANPDHVAAGAQDQGYQVTTGVTQSSTVAAFDQILSGDYAHLVSGDGTHGLVYSVYPGFILIQVGEDSPRLIYGDFPGGERYAWLPPLAADPDDPETFYLCAGAIYRYTRSGPYSWTQERWSETDLSDRSAEYVSAMQLSPVNPDRAYAVTSLGSLFASDDRGVTWSESADVGPAGQYFYGNAVLASSLNEDEVLVGGSDYESGEGAVIRSTDGGTTWSPFGQGLPPTLVYSLGEAPDGSGTYFAGTETAAYRRDPGDAGWTDITDTDAPVTIYWSVEALPHEDTMRFGTYGRGIWDYQLAPESTPCWPVLDVDGDGVDCLSDCNDADPATFPGAPEDCDGIDRSCDPSDLDERDLDGDGVIACFDCDDTDGERSPDAAEICGDGIDQDCDGADLDCPQEDTAPPTDSDPPMGDTAPPLDSASPAGAGDTDQGGQAPPKGCGCDSPAQVPTALLTLLALAAPLRRRRPRPL